MLKLKSFLESMSAVNVTGAGVKNVNPPLSKKIIKRKKKKEK